MCRTVSLMSSHQSAPLQTTFSLMHTANIFLFCVSFQQSRGVRTSGVGHPARRLAQPPTVLNGPQTGAPVPTAVAQVSPPVSQTETGLVVCRLRPDCARSGYARLCYRGSEGCSRSVPSHNSSCYQTPFFKWKFYPRTCTAFKHAFGNVLHFWAASAPLWHLHGYILNNTQIADQHWISVAASTKLSLNQRRSALKYNFGFSSGLHPEIWWWKVNQLLFYQWINAESMLPCCLGIEVKTYITYNTPVECLNKITYHVKMLSNSKTFKCPCSNSLFIS